MSTLPYLKFTFFLLLCFSETLLCSVNWEHQLLFHSVFLKTRTVKTLLCSSAWSHSGDGSVVVVGELPHGLFPFCFPQVSSLGMVELGEAPLTLLWDAPLSRRHGERSHREPELPRFSARCPFHQRHTAHGQDRVLWRKGQERHIWRQEDFLFVCHLWPLVCNITVDNRVKCKLTFYDFIKNVFRDRKQFLKKFFCLIQWITSFSKWSNIARGMEDLHSDVAQ